MKLLACCTLLLFSPFARHARAQQVLAEEIGSIASIDDVEISPDGRWAVAREHAGFIGGTSRALFYELATGQRVASLPIQSGGLTLLTGPAQDAVGVTATRAVVLASGIGIFDTSAAVPTVLHTQSVGIWPRDVAVTPDGTLAIVRGGATNLPHVGGLFVFDMATGHQLAHAPGEPRPYDPIAARGFDVDSVVADDQHAVTLSSVAGATRVTIWELRPPGGGRPRVAFETSSASDQAGEPHDIARVPGGQYAAVRSELSVALYELSGKASRQVWVRRLFGNPGPFGGASMDSIEASAGLVATISRWSNGGVGAQLDVFTLAGVPSWDRTTGDPHDLAITPDETQLVLRTSAGVSLYDLASLPAGPVTPADTALQSSTNTSFGAGLDSIAVSNTRAVTIARAGSVTDVRVWDLSAGQLTPLGTAVMPDEPLDVDLTPDGQIAAISGLSHLTLIDTADGSVLLDHDPTSASGWWPWCDGVAVCADRVVAFGYLNGAAPSPGWLSIVALDAPAP